MTVTMLGALVGIVALIQGVAWLGGSPEGGLPRWGWGMVLAPVGYGLVALACLRHLVPGFVG